MPGEKRSDHVFAVQNDVQYQPTETIGDQHVRVRGQGAAGLLLCRASRSLDMPPGDVEILFVVVHGALRDAGRYLGHAEAGAEDVISRTVIVAPQFLADVDIRARPGVPDETLYWDVEGWKGGEPALGPTALSSFAAMDSLLARLTEPGRLSGAARLRVVIFGNSAGGQFVNRYAAVGRAPDDLAKRGIRVRFIIANPSTYLYFDSERPVSVPDRSLVNRWRYGFESAPGYVLGSPGQNLERYLARDVTIVLGEQDSDKAAPLLEVSPAAMSQGASRLDRGIYYDAHVRRLADTAGLPIRHRLIRLPGVGHSARDVLVDPVTRQIMFG
jgi:hypothetical protein